MRIRSIKPEFWSSDDITVLHWYERLLLIGLWSYVDDNGVGRDRLASIAGDLFSGDVEQNPQETFTRIATGLDKLEAKGRITRYEIDGAKYLAIENWHHQRIDKPAKARYPRPTGSRHSRDTLAGTSRDNQDGSSNPQHTNTNATAPLAAGSEASESPADGAAAESGSNVPLTGHSSDSRESVAESSRGSRDTLAPGTGEQRNRGTEEQGISSSDVADATPDDYSDAFEVSTGARTFCDLLLSLMAKNDEKPRPPKPSKAWLQAADRMIRIDGRDPAVAMGLLRWAKQDDFWSPNIQSPAKFREQYVKLEAASKRTIAGPAKQQRHLSIVEKIRADEQRAIGAGQ